MISLLGKYQLPLLPELPPVPWLLPPHEPGDLDLALRNDRPLSLQRLQDISRCMLGQVNVVLLGQFEAEQLVVTGVIVDLVFKDVLKVHDLQSLLP